MKRFSWLGFVLLVTMIVVPVQAAPKVKTIPVPSSGLSVRFSPDDHTVAAYDNYLIYNDAPTPDTLPVTLYDVQTGEQIGTLSGYTDWVTGLDFNADGSQIVTFHRNGDVNLWNTADQTLIKTIATYGMGGSSVQFLPDEHSVLYHAGELVLGILDLDIGDDHASVRRSPRLPMTISPTQLRPVSGARGRHLCRRCGFAGWSLAGDLDRQRCG